MDLERKNTGGPTITANPAINHSRFIAGLNTQKVEKAGTSIKVEDINEEFKAKYPKILTGAAEALAVKMSHKVWTRGDGVRYKDFNEIYVHWRDTGTKDKWGKLGKVSKEAIDELWTRIEKRGTPVLVSGEFRSMGFSQWVKAGGYIYQRRDEYVAGDGASIQFGSASRLKNTDVWRNREP